MCWFLFNRRRRGDWGEANEAMVQAAQAFEEILETRTTGEAGILVRPSPDQDGIQAKAELERALSDLPSTVAQWSVTLDASGSPHPWVVVSGSGLPALADATRTVGGVLANVGLGSRVLAAVYAFHWKDRKIYWIYQPRIGAFTPFAPAELGEEERDHPLELRMEQASRRELPTSRDIKEWYPIWGMPI